MKPDVVIDVGNSRIKGARCTESHVAGIVQLPADDIAAWERQRAAWGLTATSFWAVAEVHRSRREPLLAWLREIGDRAWLIDAPMLLPLEVKLAHPEKVGIDRLLNAVAANTLRKRQSAAVIVDAGSAVTVDYIDEKGSFCGGTILPGCRLMSQALADYTALLPFVELASARPVPATDTRTAIEAGIFWTVLGGVEKLTQKYRQVSTGSVDVFLTGGDAALLGAELQEEFHLWPEMTLEGIRLTALQHSFNENGS